jgi:hypothetical protein
MSFIFDRLRKSIPPVTEIELDTIRDHSPPQLEPSSFLDTRRRVETYKGTEFKSDQIHIIEKTANASLFSSGYEAQVIQDVSFNNGLLQMLCKNGEMNFINTQALQRIATISLGENISAVRTLDNFILAFGEEGSLQVWDLLNFNHLYTCKLTLDLYNIQKLPMVIYKNQLYVALSEKVVKFDLSPDVLEKPYKLIADTFVESYHKDIVDHKLEERKKKAAKHEKVFELCGEYLAISTSWGKISVYNCETEEYLSFGDKSHLKCESAFTAIIDGKPTLFAKEEGKPVFKLDLTTAEREDSDWTDTLEVIKRGFDPLTMTYRKVRGDFDYKSSTYSHSWHGNEFTNKVTTISNYRSYMETYHWYEKPYEVQLHLKDSKVFITTDYSQGEIREAQENILLSNFGGEYPHTLIRKKVNFDVHPLPKTWDETTRLVDGVFYRLIYSGKACIGVEVLKTSLTNYRLPDTKLLMTFEAFKDFYGYEASEEDLLYSYGISKEDFINSILDDLN